MVKETINQPYQLIVEGHDDVEFYSRVVCAAGLTNFQVGAGRNRENGMPLGKDGFVERLNVVLSSPAEIKGCVIIADCDDDPGDRFKNAIKHLERAKLPRPKHAFEIATGENPVTEETIKTAVILVPGEGAEGGLETVLLGCCDGVTQHNACIDAFCSCVKQPGRRKIDDDKVRLRALIAATHRDDPGISLAYWVSSKNRPPQFGLGHPSLKFITDFLRHLSQ